MRYTANSFLTVKQTLRLESVSLFDRQNEFAVYPNLFDNSKRHWTCSNFCDFSKKS